MMIMMDNVLPGYSRLYKSERVAVRASRTLIARLTECYGTVHRDSKTPYYLDTQEANFLPGVQHLSLPTFSYLSTVI